MPFRLSARAAAELRDLYRYGVETFGEAAADRYYDGLLDAFDLLTRFPLMGRDVGSGLRVRVYRSHIVIYTFGRESDVEIERVVHGGSDWLSHFL